MARTLALPGTGDGRVLSRGAALASEFTTDPRAQTEAERPVAEGTCPDSGQRVCTLDRMGVGMVREPAPASCGQQDWQMLVGCLWDGREEAGHGAGARE